mgnify:CR=1 FL=1
MMKTSAVVIIDQTKLPGTTEIIALKTAQEIWDAIYLLQVRGAPAIGVAAAYGIYVLAKGIDTDNYDAFYAEFKKQKEYLDSSRPTAVNLSWALNRMEQVVLNNADKSVAEIKQLLKEESVEIQDEGVSVCAKPSVEYGLTLVKPGRRYFDTLQRRKTCNKQIRHSNGSDLSGTGARLQFPCLCR